jgi:hypothetical protein
MWLILFGLLFSYGFITDVLCLKFRHQLLDLRLLRRGDDAQLGLEIAAIALVFFLAWLLPLKAPSWMQRFYAPKQLKGGALWGCAIARGVITFSIVFGLFFRSLSVFDASGFVLTPSGFHQILSLYSLSQLVLMVLLVILAPKWVSILIRQVDSGELWWSTLLKRSRPGN